jgi:hypothetical protein
LLAADRASAVVFRKQLPVEGRTVFDMEIVVGLALQMDWLLPGGVTSTGRAMGLGAPQL